MTEREKELQAIGRKICALIRDEPNFDEDNAYILAVILGGAFSWASTKKGHDYYSDVSTALYAERGKGETR